MVQLERKHNKSGSISSFPLLVAVFVACSSCAPSAQSAPQLLDTYQVQKTANSTYAYESLNGLQRGYNYAYGNTYRSGYKTKNVAHYTGTPVIIHAPNNRSFVKFGLRRADDELVFLESKHSQVNLQTNKHEIVFETTAPDHKFSHIELFTNDPNFLLTTEFKDDSLLAKFSYTGADQTTEKLATINVYGYQNDRLPKDCFLYYLDCEVGKQQPEPQQQL